MIACRYCRHVNRIIVSTLVWLAIVIGTATMSATACNTAAAADPRRDVAGPQADGVSPAVLTDKSPLMRAIRDGHADVVASLLKNGANANTRNEQWSALMLAAFLGEAPIVTALLARGADVAAVNTRGMTSLMLAASQGHTEIVTALLAKSAKVNAIDSGGHTALMFAANNGHAETASVLLGKRADPRVTNRAGSSAASLAAGNGHAAVAALLKSPAPASSGTYSAGDRTSPTMDRQRFADAAATAWQYVVTYTQPTTGLVDATSTHAFTTVWDIASQLSALHSAHVLALIDTPDFDRRMQRVLQTLKKVDLYDGVTLSKVYSTKSGAMAGEKDQPTDRGTGWSALDVGRLLIWLRIVADTHPQHRDDATAIVKRFAMGRLIKDGYLWGETVLPSGEVVRYQEGRIGYEQYAARGFAAWGADPALALSWRENGVPVRVMGQTLLADLRGGDRLTSDPLILLGLELGWDPESEQLATQFLAAQRTRQRNTGIVTMVAEDAMPEAPYFFYYYSALANFKEFALDVQDAAAAVDKPRWVSAKAAFAWHALMPSAETDAAVQRVAPARGPSGWASGVYETSGTTTHTMNINTVGVILAAAAVHATGVPLLPRPGAQK